MYTDPVSRLPWKGRPLVTFVYGNRVGPFLSLNIPMLLVSVLISYIIKSYFKSYAEGLSRKSMQILLSHAH